MCFDNDNITIYRNEQTGETNFQIKNSKCQNCKSAEEIDQFMKTHAIQLAVIHEEYDLSKYGERPT